MLRFLADENFNGRILRGLLRRIPDLDGARAQDVDEIQGSDEPVLLEWAADQDLIVLSYDVSTLAEYADLPGRRPVPRPASEPTTVVAWSEWSR